MNIGIKNFKNINQVDLKLERNKINVLYGITGSGKSSIAQAFIYSKDIPDYFIPFGKTRDDVNIKLTGIDPTDIKYYSRETVNKIILEQEEDGIYTIYFDEDDEINKINEELKKLLNIPIDLDSKLIKLLSEYEKFNKDIFKTKSSKKSRTGLALSKTSPLKRITKTIEQLSIDNPIFRFQSISHLNWVKNGLKSFSTSSRHCPFCMQSLTTDSDKLLKDINNLDVKSLEKVFVSNKEIFERIELPIEEVVKDEELLFDAMSKLEPIINDINRVKNVTSSEHLDISIINELKLNEDTYKVIDGLREFCIDFNKKIDDLKKRKIELAKKSSVYIKGIKKDVNILMRKLSINYKIEYNNSSIDYQSSKCRYKLIHHNYNTVELNLQHNLSEGEKNLISLIMFLLQEPSKNSLLILDDPISSTDEQRRKNILDLLLDFLKDKTILILTHDQIFLKVLTYERHVNKSLKSKIGFIKHIASDTNNTIKDIVFDDMSTIMKHCNSSVSNKSSLFSKVIAIRLSSEYDKNTCKKDQLKKFRDIYTYISGVYKFLAKRIKLDEFTKRLTESNIDEKELISSIKSEYSLDLTDFTVNRSIDVELSKLSNIDKVFYYRYDNTISNSLRDEISSWIHLTDAQVLTLNPYKFNVFTPSMNQLFIK